MNTLPSLDLGFDLDGVVLWKYMAKAVWGLTNRPDWREGFAKWYANQLRAAKDISFDEAYNEGLVRAQKYPTLPPELTSRRECIHVLGEADYKRMSTDTQKEITLRTPLRLGAAECLEGLLEDGHRLHLVTSRVEKSFELARQRLERYNWFQTYNPFDRKKHGESKLGYCEGMGLDALVEDEPGYLIGDPGKRFLKVLVGAGISAEEKQMLLTNPPEFIDWFFEELAKAKVKIPEFLDMLVGAGDRQLSTPVRFEEHSEPVLFKDVAARNNPYNIIYVPGLSYVRQVVRGFTKLQH